MLLIVLALVVAAPPAAAQRQADLHAADDVLEPNPDGSYYLPLPGMESVTLRWEPGEMPVELAALRISEDGDSLVADIRYVGEKVVTGWQVKTGSVRSDGHEYASMMMGTDWRANGDPDARILPPGYRVLGGPYEHEEAIQPGEVRSVDIGSASGPHLVELVLSVPLLVFEDASFLGSSRLARDMLGNRSKAAEETARWLERLDEVLRSTSGEWELRRALEVMLAEMEPESEDPLQRYASATRQDLARNLRSILAEERASRSHSSKRDQVRSLIDRKRSTLESMIDHVPEELPEDDGPPGRVLPKNVEEGPGGDPGGDTELDCDCGGSISDNVVRNQTIICGPQKGWTVDESWDVTCLDENGDSIGSRPAQLHGFGACIEDSFCLDATYCPPEFQGPSITQVETMRRWHRWVRNKRVNVGFCFGERCDVVSVSAVDRYCDCAPMPRPRCFADGCPILIETGTGGFQLTGVRDGVSFDLTGLGIPSRVAWTAPGGDDAWLVLDRNGNGRIDDATELFGDRTDQPAADEPHGFLALAVFDDPAHGGDGDGTISAADAVFPELRLWLDHDHDGVTDLGELVPLASADIAAIELDFFRSERRDRHGNRFRYSARVRLASGGHRLATDVFLRFE